MAYLKMRDYSHMEIKGNSGPFYRPNDLEKRIHRISKSNSSALESSLFKVPLDKLSHRNRLFTFKLKNNPRQISKLIKLIPCNNHVTCLFTERPFVGIMLEENITKVRENYRRSVREYEVEERSAEELESPLLPKYK